MSKRTFSYGYRFVRHVLWNLFGNASPLVLAAFCIPTLLSSLGTEAFGFLTLVWAAVGYFNLFDFGLSRALTKVVSEERLSPFRERLLAIVTSGLAIIAGMASIASFGFAIGLPYLVDSYLQLTPTISEDAVGAIPVLAVTLLFVIVGTGLRGVLEGFEDFASTSVVRVLLAVAQFVGPLFVLDRPSPLTTIAVVLLVARAASCVALAARLYWLLRGWAGKWRVRVEVIGRLLRFGGWITISGIVSPILVYVDRFVIGATVPMAQVAYYTTPHEIVSRLVLIPESIMGVLFPKLSTAFATNHEAAEDAFQTVSCVMIFAMGMTCLGLILVAHPALEWWLNAEFAENTSLILQILVVGLFANAVARPAYAVLQSSGRPDLTAKLHLGEAPLYAIALWWTGSTWGMTGMAFAWAARMTVDLFALTALSARTVSVRESVRGVMVFISLLIACVVLQSYWQPSSIHAVTTYGIAWVLVLILAWRNLIPRMYRQRLLTVGRSLIGR